MNPPGPVTTVLFDFDGTLADSFVAITASTNHVRESYGLPPLPSEVVREYVGFGLENLMQTLVPGAATAEAVGRYREHHVTVMASGTKLMPDVKETLGELASRGLKMAVCSNKKVDFTRKLVADLSISSLFAAVLGPEDVGGRAKPDPAMLVAALSRLGSFTTEAVYIGDMAIDVHAARAADLPVWIVPGGAAGLESVASAGPDRVLTSFQELLALLLPIM